MDKRSPHHSNTDGTTAAETAAAKNSTLSVVHVCESRLCLKRNELVLPALFFLFCRTHARTVTYAVNRCT